MVIRPSRRDSMAAQVAEHLELTSRRRMLVGSLSPGRGNVLSPCCASRPSRKRCHSSSEAFSSIGSSPTENSAQRSADVKSGLGVAAVAFFRAVHVA
eukprot:CAMPEP_0174701824 /NCGR_PEP_ID=MMETSP1094-20130205/6333_1 /TAXON_ID=156173 /ORGANISM="Chrysochromulina brevifilum, Strain UTEX LB 985" /LENGTH=96 /DNA_ID=CAMNT_0015899523 /DNA_START=269 /DNA_END=559 /DNA_ORIENTATION=-